MAVLGGPPEKPPAPAAGPARTRRLNVDEVLRPTTDRRLRRLPQLLTRAVQLA
jgi:hypothetical protein